MTRNDSLVSMALIDAAIAKHGARKVLLASLGALLRPTKPDTRNARRQRTEPPLSNHLRRDIGLDAQAPPDGWSLLR